MASGWASSGGYNAIQVRARLLQQIMDRELENAAVREAIEALEAGEL